MIAPDLINQVPPAVLADPGGVAHTKDTRMSTDHRTDPDHGESTITTTGTVTTATLTPRTRDVVVRGLHAYLASPASTCNLQGLLPPELADAEPGTLGTGDPVADADVRNEVRQNSRLYHALCCLTVGYRVWFGSLNHFHDLEVLVSSGRAEVGRQLAAEPAEKTEAVAVLTDLDRLQRHATALRDAAATGATTIELETA